MKKFQHLILIVLLLSLIIPGISIYQLFATKKIIEIVEPIRIITPKIYAGGPVTYRIDYCKCKPIAGTFWIELQNHRTIFLPSAVSNRPVGCDINEITFEMPDYAIPGEYIMFIHTEYRDGERLIKKTFKSEKFIVLKK
jgi:hypothetical protein